MNQYPIFIQYPIENPKYKDKIKLYNIQTYVQQDVRWYNPASDV